VLFYLARKRGGDVLKMAKDYAKNFYNSYRWRRCAKAYAKSQLYICERCHGLKRNIKSDGTRQRWVVHHKKPLNSKNIYDDSIAYGWENLMLLCIECHNAIHAELDRLSMEGGLTSGARLLVKPSRGLTFGLDGDLIAINDNNFDNK
jgi:hypothetical protein